MNDNPESDRGELRRSITAEMLNSTIPVEGEHFEDKNDLISQGGPDVEIQSHSSDVAPQQYSLSSTSQVVTEVVTKMIKEDCFATNNPLRKRRHSEDFLDLETPYASLEDNPASGIINIKRDNFSKSLQKIIKLDFSEEEIGSSLQNDKDKEDQKEKNTIQSIPMNEATSGEGCLDPPLHSLSETSLKASQFGEIKSNECYFADQDTVGTVSREQTILGLTEKICTGQHIDGVTGIYEDTGDSRRIFREWHECAVLQTYNGEKLLALPYTVID